MKENNLDDWKLTYHSIPVPEELEFRVKSSIRQAKEDLGQTAPVRKKRPFWKSSVLTAAAAMLTIVLLANSSAGMASALEGIPVLGDIFRVFTFRTFEARKDNTSARIDVPRVEGGAIALNAAIEEYTSDIIAQYSLDAAQLQDFASDPDAPPSESARYELDLSYTVVTDSPRLFSLRFDQLLVMASGSQSVKIYSMDKESRELLTLSNLFLPGSEPLLRISDAIKAQMQSQMDADESVYYWLNDDIAAWNFQSVTDETAFYVNNDGDLVIMFNEGDVAPMYMGLCEFVLPAESLSDIANPDYLGK